MATKIMGYKRLDYVSKKTGNPVKGYSLYFAGPADGVQGEEVFNLFLGDDVFAPVVAAYPVLTDIVGKEVTVMYNRFGHPVRITFDKIK